MLRPYLVSQDVSIFFLYQVLTGINYKPRVQTRSRPAALLFCNTDQSTVSHKAASLETLPDPLLRYLSSVVHLSSNGDLNLNTGLDVDDDLLDGLGGGEQAVRRSESVMFFLRQYSVENVAGKLTR